MDADRLVQKALRFISEHRTTGDLLMDVPRGASWEELQELAVDRVNWRKRVNVLSSANVSRATVTMNESLPVCLVPRRITLIQRLKTQNTPNQVTPLSTRKYLVRDAQTMFFRPGEKGKRK